MMAIKQIPIKEIKFANYVNDGEKTIDVAINCA